MYFENIHIQNFRGISELSINDNRMINLFVGKNNACKTTILEAYATITGMSNPGVIVLVNNFRGLPFKESNDLRYLFRNLDYKYPLKISAQLEKNSHRELAIKPSSKESKNSEQRTYSVSNLQNNPIFNFEYKERDVTELVFDFKIKQKQVLSKDYKAKILFDSKGDITIQEAKGYLEKLKGIYLAPNLWAAANLEKKLEEIILNKKQKDIIEVLQIIDKNIVDISFGINRMIYFDIGIDRLVPINLMGDGTRRLVLIILSIYDAKNGVVLIDEIETGLHFSVLLSLWKVIFAAAQKFNVQVFATTHNIEVLKYLQAAAADDTVFQDNICSYTIRKGKEDKFYSYRYGYEQFSFSIEQGIEMR
jgi:AAA15 family ATPase/GTPase